MKIVFFCGDQSRYGLGHLAPLLRSRFEIAAIVVGTEQRWCLFREALQGKEYLPQETSNPRGLRARCRDALQPLRSKVRSLIAPPPVQAPGLQERLEGRDIPVFAVFDVNAPEAVQKIRELQPDLIISAAYPQIFSKELISVPPRGSVNCHPSLLPRYRGAHPHFWTIVNGEELSGLTAHFMTEKIDDGDVLAQVEYPVAQYSYSGLYDKMVAETEALVKLVDDFFHLGTGKAVPQDHGQATYYRNDREIHKRIFWSRHDAAAVYHLIRTEQAFCFFRHKRMAVVDGYCSISNRNLTNGVLVDPGTVVDLYRDALAVKTVDGCINIRAIEMDGERLDYRQFVSRHRVQIGEILT
jgi:methionyl-tRNA formyltransferase